MKTRKWKDVEAEMFSPEERAEIRRGVAADMLELNLRALREMAEKTQAEIASELDTTQGEISRMERRGDWLLSSLRRYVAALGGELEVVARFGDKSVHLHVPEDGEAQHA